MGPGDRVPKDPTIFSNFVIEGLRVVLHSKDWVFWERPPDIKRRILEVFRQDFQNRKREKERRRI